MPNPRYISNDGSPTIELISKLETAKLAYLGLLPAFSREWGGTGGLENIEDVYLIGSHATDNDWKDETSDLDLKLVIPDFDIELGRPFLKNFLRPLLCRGRKRDWIDLFLVHADYQVISPRYSLISSWNSIILPQK